MKLSISLGQRRGKQSQDRKRRSLLVEPTSDDEDDCPQTVIHGKSEPASMPNEQKSGRFALASLLVILFGALLVSVQQIGCTAVDQSTLPVGNLTASLLPVSSNSTTTDSSASLQDSTTTMGTTSDDSLEETEEDITEPSSSSGSRLDSEPEESTTESSQPLTKLLVDSAGQAADQLVGRLRGSESEIEAEETPTEPDRRRNSDTQVQGEANSSSSIDTEQLRLAFDTYAKWRHAGDDFIELFSRKLLPVIMEHGYDVDAQTVGGLLQVFNGIRALKPWALKLLDASAKISPGILVGTQSDFGDFDECLNIRADDPSGLGIMGEIDQLTGLPRSTLVGKYCLADIEFPKPPRERLPTRNEELQTDYAAIELRRPLLNFSETAAYKDTIFVETGNFFHMLYVDPLRVGVCLTNKIDADSFAQVFNKLFDEFKVTINFRGRCVTKYDKPVWTLQQRISAHVILIVCSLVFLSTGFDILHKRWHRLPGLGATTGLSHLDLDGALNKYRPVLTAFSIIRNTKRLMKPQQAIRQKVQPLQLTDPILSAQSSSPSLTSSTASSPCTDRRSSLASSDANLIGNDRCDLLVSSINNKTGNLLSIDMVRPAQILKQSESKSQQQPEADLMCLHGIRVITMTWMIVNHTYLFGGFFVLWAHRRLIDIAEWPKSVSFQLVLNGWLTVETYFFLSAAIIVLNVMPLMKSKRFSYLPYIFHRLVRLLPAYTGLVALNFLWPLISSGPVWLVKGKSFIQTPCENYLWTNFLFINNWIWPEKQVSLLKQTRSHIGLKLFPTNCCIFSQCMVHTWFLSADFQLYLLAPIVVYLLYR